MVEKILNSKINVCEEAPVDLIVNGRKLVTFMCTPESLKILSIGYMYAKGLINSMDDVKDIGILEDIRKVVVTTKQMLDTEQFGLGGVLTSGCGSGTVISDTFLKRKPIETQLKIQLNKLKELAIKMFQGAEKYKEMGGIHCAALSDGEDLITLKEDIGRHNAVDKIVGAGLLFNVNFTETIVLTTGRLSSDMVLKAIACNVPIVTSRSIPTSLAIELAEALGVTIVGRIASKEPIIYTHHERIIIE